MPKHRKDKKPIRKRKPSRPLDGINHRLIREMAEKTAMAIAVTEKQDDNMPPTREEMAVKATELGIKFDGRTSDAKLLERINEALRG